MQSAVAESNMAQAMEPLKRMHRDLAKAAASLTLDEVRFAVDLYYQVQTVRIAAAAQIRSSKIEVEPEEGAEIPEPVLVEEPTNLLQWTHNSMATIETGIKSAMDKFTDAHELGRWAKSITGVGPIITAGLMAQIDIEKAPTVGHIWSFAGLNPESKWEKGQKRPFNAGLKTLCWKIGECFVKVSGNERDYYGHVYKERKLYEIARNDAGELAGQAEAKLLKFKIGKTTDAYKAYSVGKLPPAHIHARARRYAVKLFLAHFHHVAYEIRYGVEPPKPFIIEHGGHTHYIKPPNWK